VVSICRWPAGPLQRRAGRVAGGPLLRLLLLDTTSTRFDRVDSSVDATPVVWDVGDRSLVKSIVVSHCLRLPCVFFHRAGVTRVNALICN